MRPGLPLRTCHDWVMHTTCAHATVVAVAAHALAVIAATCVGGRHRRLNPMPTLPHNSAAASARSRHRLGVIAMQRRRNLRLHHVHRGEPLMKLPNRGVWRSMCAAGRDNGFSFAPRKCDFFQVHYTMALTLSLACWDYDRVRALQDGRVRPEGVHINFLNHRVEETWVWRPDN